MLSIEGSAELLNAIRYRNLQPKAIVVVVGISAHLWHCIKTLIGLDIALFRELAGWQVEHVFGPASWDPVLNYTDPDFGTSQGFYDAYFAASTYSSVFVCYLFSFALQSVARRILLTWLAFTVLLL